jgi:uncharacterized protein (TIGR02147 family)
MESLTIFNYTDYRTFLKDYVQKKKEVQPTFSLGTWSKRLGISSTAVLVNILNGKRNPGGMISEKFVTYFRFTEKESQYFSDLISLTKVISEPRLSLALMEKMGRLHPDGTFKLLDDKTFSSISKWYYYALKEMVELPYFIEDAEWIKEHLEYEVSSKEIKKAIQDFLDLGLLKRDASGRLKVTTKTLRSTTDVSSEALKRFHEQVLENGKASIRKHGLLERDFSSRTINIREENLPMLKEYIKEFRDKVSELFEESVQSSRVYQINIQLIPLTSTEK